ncbi:MAG: DUF4956 domain-containing protein [Oscillospiraceae bacterium]|nr:DUF4956 domain-containing protein [Oscillospiraceae bacterium]
MLSSIITSSDIGMSQFLICTAVSIILGLIIAYIHSYKNRSTSGFLLTVGLIPVIVQVIIMLVNGNLGAGVAVAGAFSLVRFRSAPGTAREIVSLFLAMTAGLATGMGYLIIAAIMVIIVGIMTVILPLLFNGNSRGRQLQITVPESLDYEGAFEDIMRKYTDKHEMLYVKTVQMGTAYKLIYEVLMKNEVSVKNFLDEIRIRNGNLEVSIGREIDRKEETSL